MTDSKHVAVRLAAAALARLARIQDAMGAKLHDMGVVPSQSDALRAIIAAGFPVVEKQYGLPPGKSGPFVDGRKVAKPSERKQAKRKGRVG